MKILQILAVLVVVIFVGCSTYSPALQVSPCTEQKNSNKSFPNTDEIEHALDKLVESGVPGAAMAVYSKEYGWWSASAGFAKIEGRVPMRVCHLMYLQSISKTYMAAAILKLYEEGKINLDDPVTKYLPTEYSHYISRAEEITVRMLLNHTSGIPEYGFVPDYVAYLLQHPEHRFKSKDYLEYIEGKPLDFTPGSRYSYRNTNYLLLAIIADEITGDHAQYMTDNIFKPLGLHHTFYKKEKGYLSYTNLVNAYWDRYSNGIIENVSQLQRNNVASLIGDDGIVTTPKDGVLFLRGLLEGRLLPDSTLTQMKDWVHDKKGKPRYGLGMGYTTFEDFVAIGHSGGGIGAGAELRYFPEKKLYVFIGINLGTVTGSPLHVEAGRARDQLFRALLE